jgi:hypothetical protein
MIKAFAPRDLGGCSWVLLSILLVVGLPDAVRSQTTAKNASAPGQNPAPVADDAAAEKPEAAESAPEKASLQVETFRDKHVENLLPNTFQQLGKPARSQDFNQVKSMAGGGSNTDRAVVERFVGGCINELTSRSNIRAVIDPNANIPAGAAANYAIQVATDNLVEPLLTARAVGNNSFLSTYIPVLIQSLPPLLENHLLARIEAMLVLSQTGSPTAVDLFVKQINDPGQSVWVNLWAARGLTQIAQSGNYSLSTEPAIRAGKALSDFLLREKELPWPVQYRAFEALGSMRQASTIRPEKGQPEMASTAALFLTDPETRLEVRAEAGWALGMIQVQGMPKYNYPMLAFYLGELAAAVGDRIHSVQPGNANQAEALTALLVTQIYQAFEGVPSDPRDPRTLIRESGLLRSSHPNAMSSRPYIKQVYDKTKPVIASSVKLVKGPSGQATQNLQDLEAKVAELKAWLVKNQPADFWLVPEGPKYPVSHAQLVRAPADAAQVADRPVGPGR